MPNILASYMQGQQAVENNKRNRLLDMQIAYAPAQQARANKLAELQLANQQKNLDAGKFELDTARQTQTKAQEIEALKRGIAGAQYVAQSKSPKLEAEQRYPDFVQQFKAGGGNWDQLDDNAVRDMAGGLVNQLSARAGIGPKQKFVTERRDDGSIIQTDPATGEIKEAVKGKEDFKAKAEFTDKLARQRDAEQRSFTLQRDANNAALQRELTKQRALSKDEKATDGQRLSAGFLLRMRDVEPSFGTTNPETGEFVPSYKPNTKDYVLFNKILKNEGGFFGSGTAAELNKQLSPEAQQYFQQATDWVRAKLRKESGAAIGAQEMLSEVSTYFPLPGDSPKTIQNKARSREVAIEAMEIAAGAVGKNAEGPRPRQTTQAPAQNAAPRQIANEADYNALPSGTQYIGPDGQLRQKR